MRELAGKVAVVTGAGSGIGLGLATRLAQEGMTVVMADIRDDELAASAARLEGSGGHVVPMVADVAQPEAVVALAGAVYDQLGAVDVLCSNAGIIGPPVGTVLDTPLSEWRAVFDVNVFGFMNCARAFVPRMVAAEAPAHIVVTVSVVGLMTTPAPAPYFASKHALLSACESLRLELEGRGSRIGLSMLMPGPVRTNGLEHELARPGRWEGARFPSQDDIVKTAVPIEQQYLEPSDIAERAVEAIRNDRLYVFTHDDAREMVTPWVDRVLAALPD